MITETLRYEADGLKMESRFYCDEAKKGPRPGVLVFPEAFGIGPHAYSRAERLAREGYAALACDLHGNAGTIEEMEKVMGLLGHMMSDPSHIRARTRTALAALTARPEVDKSRVAAIGFCFGGTMSIELARSGADIKGAVGFHSGLGTPAPQDTRNIKGKVLVMIGADDPMITAEQRTAFETQMREAGVDWQMTLYGGVVHSFTNPDADKRNMPNAIRYDARAERRSWAQMHDFFGEIFG
jgi:dienelactone hydrolase